MSGIVQLEMAHVASRWWFQSNRSYAMAADDYSADRTGANGRHQLANSAVLGKRSGDLIEVRRRPVSEATAW